MPVLAPWMLPTAIAAIFLAGAAGGWLGYDYASSKCKAAEADRRALIAEVRSANLDLARGVSKDTATAISRIRVQHQTINNEVRHEREIHHAVLENPDCGVPGSTVGVLRRARGYGVDDRPAAGEPGRAMPAAGGSTAGPAPGR